MPINKSFLPTFLHKVKSFPLQIQKRNPFWMVKWAYLVGSSYPGELITNLRLGNVIMKLQYFYLIAKVDLMSFFLLPDAQIDRILMKQRIHNLPNHPKYPYSQQTQKQAVNFEAEARKLGEGTPHVILEDHACKQLVAMVGGLVFGYKNLVSISFNKLTQRIRVQLQLLAPQNTPFKAGNTRALLQLANKARNSLEDSLLQVSFNLANGAFALRFPLHAASYPYFNPIVSRGRSIVEYVLKNYVEDTLPLLKMVTIDGRGELQADNSHNSSALDHALKYLQLSHVRSLITQSNTVAEEEIAHADRQQRAQIDRMNKNNMPIPEWFHRLSSFFSCGGFIKMDVLPKYRLDFTQEEQRFVQSRITMPVQPKPKSPAENLLILNHIYVYDLSALKLKMIDEGGFSSIFVTDIRYVCVQPTPGYQPVRINQAELTSHKNILLKRVIVKKEDEECSFSRNRHQLEIIRAIRQPSVFLPKYYNVVNNPNPHSGALLMDYIPFDTLTGYIRKTRLSISLRTKLILLYSAVQSLRFLRDQHIVHLDLKPNNIMLFHNLLVKLIDFGESYHPEVCSKNNRLHKPGFTIPYSSPEIFSNETKVFTSKSDVFSLGVVMFEVLYQSYPYDIFEQTELIDDIMSNYLKKWLFVPEEFEKYGDVRVLRIMNACISKCLSPNVAHRPELDWLAIILRCCIDYLE